jgi:hypothetical protein
MAWGKEVKQASVRKTTSFMAAVLMVMVVAGLAFPRLLLPVAIVAIGAGFTLVSKRR